MTREERKLSIEYLEGVKDNYIEGHGYERHPLPEYYAIENAIKALEQEPQTFEWCHDCSEYDHNKHCCPRYNKVIRNAVEEIKQPKMGHWISYWDEEARCYVYKCPECGNKQPFDTKHCWECGTKLSEISTGSESEKT